MARTYRFCGCLVAEECFCTSFPCSEGCGTVIPREACRWRDGKLYPIVVSRICKPCKSRLDAISHAKHREKRMAQQREYRSDPEVMARINAQKREYSKSERGKEVQRLSRMKPEVKARRRNEYLQKRYGITQADYDQMLAEQNGVCAICKNPDAWPGKGGNYHVDHCHDSGVVRGLLCSACNTALGTFGDDESRLIAAADYLRAARMMP